MTLVLEASNIGGSARLFSLLFYCISALSIDFDTCNLEVVISSVNELDKISRNWFGTFNSVPFTSLGVGSNLSADLITDHDLSIS